MITVSSIDIDFNSNTLIQIIFGLNAHMTSYHHMSLCFYKKNISYNSEREKKQKKLIIIWLFSLGNIFLSTIILMPDIQSNWFISNEKNICMKIMFLTPNMFLFYISLILAKSFFWLFFTVAGPYFLTI